MREFCVQAMEVVICVLKMGRDEDEKLGDDTF